MNTKLFPLAVLVLLAVPRAQASGPETPSQMLSPSRSAPYAAIPASAAGIEAAFASMESSLAGADEPAVQKSCKAHAGCRPYYVQVDALYWHRVGTGCDRELALDNNALIPGDDVLMSTDDLDFDYEPGARVLVGWLPDPCHGCGWCCAWELSYFGIYTWEAGAAVTGTNDISIPGVAGLAWNNFGLANIIQADYDSALHNVELNCLKSCCLDACTRIDFLCGFRFLTLQEDFSLIGTDFNEGTSSYDISTENYLYGLQMGGRLRRYFGGCAVELTGKAGVFLNDASQSQRVFDFPNDNLVRPLIGSDGQSPAALGELGVTFIRPITGLWSLRVGYQALGIGGLALAPGQLDFNDTFTSGSALHKDGWIFVHGAHVGVEAAW